MLLGHIQGRKQNNNIAIRHYVTALTLFSQLYSLEHRYAKALHDVISITTTSYQHNKTYAEG